jgi:hypothetical protein
MYGGAAPFPPGVDSLRRWHAFGTGNSVSTDGHPVIADVDNDNEAEIVYTYWPAYVDGAGVAEQGRVVALWNRVKAPGCPRARSGISTTTSWST